MDLAVIEQDMDLAVIEQDIHFAQNVVSSLFAYILV